MHHALLVLIISLFILVQPTHAATVAVGAKVIDYTPAYDGPSPTYRLLANLLPDTRILIRERNHIGNWLLVSWVADEQSHRGWVMIGYITLPPGLRLSEIPVHEIADIKDQTAGDERTAALYELPTLSGIDPAMCAIYKRSQNPNVVSKVGDSNSVSELYLAGIEDPGPYDFLSETLDYFDGSFASSSAAARVGMNAASVFDSMWSSQELCEAGESPLACEYRRSEPAVAVIMFGANDTHVLSTEDYEKYMRQLVETTLASDIVPVLVTFTTNPEVGDYQALLFNEITVNLAHEYHTPLINFWAAARSLPRAGVGDDNVHLTQTGSHFMLGRDESFYGLPLHNLLVLHVLNEIRNCT